MSDDLDLRERMKRATASLDAGDPPVAALSGRGRARRLRRWLGVTVVATVLALASAGPLIGLSGLAEHDPAPASEGGGPAFAAKVGYRLEVTVPTGWTLLQWLESPGYFPDGHPDAQPLIQLTSDDPGLFATMDADRNFTCDVSADGALLRVEVTSDAADDSIPPWPVALRPADTPCGPGEAAAWRSGATSFRAIVVTGPEASEATIRTAHETFAAMHDVGGHSWFAVGGDHGSVGAAQVLSSGQTSHGDWNVLAYPAPIGGASGKCYGWVSLFPEDLLTQPAEPFSQMAQAGCSRRDPLYPDALGASVGIGGGGCIYLNKQGDVVADVSGYAGANVTRIDVQAGNEQLSVTPVEPPPGFDIQGHLLWVVPHVHSGQGTVQAVGPDGPIGNPARFDECFDPPSP